MRHAFVPHTFHGEDPVTLRLRHPEKIAFAASRRNAGLLRAVSCTSTATAFEVIFKTLQVCLLTIGQVRAPLLGVQDALGLVALLLRDLGALLLMRHRLFLFLFGDASVIALTCQFAEGLGFILGAFTAVLLIECSEGLAVQAAGGTRANGIAH